MQHMQKKKEKSGNCWIGLFSPDCIDSNSNISFSWIGNAEMEITYYNWNNNEPSNNGCCVLINDNDGTWNDVPCDRLRYAVCGICDTQSQIPSLTHNIFIVFAYIFFLCGVILFLQCQKN